nr:putative quinol monooxygenase [uncultured Sphingomonas sp.]
MSEPLILFARLKAQPGQAEALELVLRALVGPTRAEAGCLTYVLHRAIALPDTWLLYESWASRAALDAHFAQPYMQALMSRVPALVDGAVEMTFATTIGE